MKKFYILAAAVLGLSAVACSNPSANSAAEEGADVPVVEKTLKDYEPSKGLVDSVSYLVGINFGSFIKGYNFGELNYSQVKKGMLDFVNCKGSQRDPDFTAQFKINPEEMNELFNEYLEMRQAYTALLNKQKGEEFLAKNLKQEGVQATASGLQYKVLDPGTGAVAGPQDTVSVYYKGTLLDETVFDQCLAEDGVPATLTLDRVIKGWTEGLQLVAEGGKIVLWIPADLAYGERAQGTIEANSTLKFEIELVKVSKVAVEEPAE